VSDFRFNVPKIVWGDALGNTIIFPGPPDTPQDYPEPYDSSEIHRFPSGMVDAWDGGTIYLVEFTVRHVPLTNLTAFGYTATGWQEANGWAAFLAWAWDAGVFDLYPDKDAATKKSCILLKPRSAQYGHEKNTGLKQIPRFVAKSDDDTAFNWY